MITHSLEVDLRAVLVPFLEESPNRLSIVCSLLLTRLPPLQPPSLQPPFHHNESGGVVYARVVVAMVWASWRAALLCQTCGNNLCATVSIAMPLPKWGIQNDAGESSTDSTLPTPSRHVCAALRA